MSVTIKYDKCVPGCFECREICPHDVLWPSEETAGEKAGKPELRYPEDCHNCYMLWNCERVCPQGAIEVSPTITYDIWLPV